MYTVDLKIECQVISAREIPRHNNNNGELKEHAAKKRLVYGSTGFVIPNA
ncbi:hypothetical protein T4C_6557 [Trichinella pseudospiralis]|uniref:Uncharacterized protein n=1 Tax=Trichinella pseudospiralis TaxID=6337 RepID=A0A0V1GNK4_TRIPS|nr:hypothetical protein T4C_6557 [Trichinella pseudospiralis]